MLKMTFAPPKQSSIGTVDQILSEDIIEKIDNDGDNTYLHLRQECHTNTPITGDGTTFVIPLTNVQCDVTQFDKSFINLNLNIVFDIDGYAAKTADTDDTGGEAFQVFLGLKHASDIISEYALFHRGRQVAGTLQSNGTIESFLYNSLRNENDLMYRGGSYSIDRYVYEQDSNCRCGSTVSLKELQTAAAGNGYITVNFNFIIPFTDILLFQQFTHYPQALFGDLELRFKVNKRALVCLQMDPRQFLKSGNLTTTKILNKEALRETLATRDYTQVGDKFVGVTKAKFAKQALNAVQGLANLFGTAEWSVMNLSVGDVSFTPLAITVNECYADICGYKVQSDKLEKMRNKYTNKPWVKFTQNVQYLPFSTSPSTTGISATQQIYLNNTTDLILLFPTTANECGGTVYKNPMLDNLSLTLMNRKYPEVAINTCSPECTQMMLNATDDLHRVPLMEYSESIATPRWLVGAVGEAVTYYHDRDLTRAIFTFKVERPSAMGLICDGLDSKGQQVPIRLTASNPMGGDDNTYCNREGGVPPPILVTVNDACLMFNAKDGGKCQYANGDFNDQIKTFMA